MADLIKFTTGLARLVQGDAYQGKDRNDKGVMNVYKSGTSIGQSFNSYFMGVAIPKNVDANNFYVPWEQEPWGQEILRIVKTSFPHCYDPATGELYSNIAMAYKVTDGDSQIPNTKQKKPCDRDGFPGHWVLQMTHNGQQSPPTYLWDQTLQKYVPLAEQLIQRGGYVEVSFTVSSNKTDDKPGVFLNNRMVVHLGYGPAILGGADPMDAGFTSQQAALPSYVSQVPLGVPQQQAAPAQQPVTAGMTVPTQQAQQQAAAQGQQYQAPAAPQHQQAAPQVPVQQQQAAPQVPVQQQQQAAPQAQQGAPQQQAAPQVQQGAPQQQAAPQVQAAHDMVQQAPQQQAAPQAPAQNAAPPVPPQQQAAQEESYILDGQVYTRTQLLGFPGWSEANLAGLQLA